MCSTHSPPLTHPHTHLAIGPTTVLVGPLNGQQASLVVVHPHGLVKLWGWVGGCVCVFVSRENSPLPTHTSHRPELGDAVFILHQFVADSAWTGVSSRSVVLRVRAERDATRVSDNSTFNLPEENSLTGIYPGKC